MATDRDLRWVEIDSGAIAHNTRAVKELIGPGVKLLAVVKADGYGCGMTEVARTVLGAGAEYLGVSSLEEGVELRRAGIEAPILLLTPLLEEQAPSIVQHRLTPTVSSPGLVRALAGAAGAEGVILPVHLLVETGLGRAGVKPGSVVEIASLVVSLPSLYLEGIYTHFAAASYRPYYTARQFRLLLAAAEALRLEGLKAPLRHAASSSATLRYPEMRLEMVRVGTLLYGQYPAGRIPALLDLRDPWRVKARVLEVSALPAGSRVGYGGEYRLRRNSHLALIALGHADGFSVAPVSRPKTPADLARRLAKEVLSFLGVPGEGLAASYRGHRLPVVGRVGMELSVLDATAVSEIHPGDEVEVELKRLSASPRLPRIYFRDGRPYRRREWQGQERELTLGL